MTPLVEMNLALILFLPWFLILAVLFWVYPRQPRGARRRLFDIASLLVAVAVFVASLYWAHATADNSHGRMWHQILATAVGYGVFLAVMTLAVVLRMWLFRRR
jgi:glucan phosphoethanolaminetransferase (alkaline phosphatase superfamily)